jgi:DNA-binding HxlR family transcriptional regulator
VPGGYRLTDDGAALTRRLADLDEWAAGWGSRR